MHTSARACAACYEHFVEQELQQNRRNHPKAYDWMESKQIDRSLSQVLLTDTSRALANARKYMFKLRNDKLKTMSKMNEKWKTHKKATYYSEHVLSKYKQNTCLAGCGSEETTEHVLKCKLSNIER